MTAECHIDEAGGRVIEPLEELRAHDGRHGPREQEQRQRDAAAAVLRVDRERRRDAQNDLERHRAEGEHGRRLRGAPESRVDGEEGVVLEAGEARHVEDRDAPLEREPDHPDGRIHGERAQRQDGRRHAHERATPIGGLATGHRTACRKKPRRVLASAIARSGAFTPTSAAENSGCTVADSNW
jgi:hypothetical protein